MTLIDAGNATAAAANVVQYSLSDFKADAEALEAGGDSAAQVVHIPGGQCRRWLASVRGDLCANLCNSLIQRPL